MAEQVERERITCMRGSIQNLYCFYLLRSCICIAKCERMPTAVIRFCCRLVPHRVGHSSSFEFSFKIFHLQTKERKEGEKEENVIWDYRQLLEKVYMHVKNFWLTASKVCT